MKTHTVIIAEDGTELINPEDGFIVHGCIFTAELENSIATGGLIGDSQTSEALSKRISLEYQAFSKNDFLRALKITKEDCLKYIEHITPHSKVL